ncbi:MAG TPA: ABC transporter ATP-binding protein [Caulobacteraceae bacterium]|nr:ABC transporter ATP-binding protein [Caulobacteraceae bacterium]
MPTSSEGRGDLAICAEGLGKAYVKAAGGARGDTLRDGLSAALAKLGRAEPRAARSRFWALQDASFQIRHGENVGVLGLNGAGKSTLLKLLSRVTAPTTGRATINGRLGSLLEVGTGFHGELTGRENIFLYGSILGMRWAEVARKLDEIVAFAGVEEFVDTPVKRYSSGMYVRLAFSVAAHLDPDVLLLDEVLSVGDLPFQRKCMAFAKDLQNRHATILFVSHNMFSIKTMCERVLYLKKGRIVFDGPTNAGIELYEADGQLEAAGWAAPELVDPSVRILDVEIADQTRCPRSVFDHGERLRLRFDYEAKAPIRGANFVVVFIRSDEVACCCYSTELDGLSLDLEPGVNRLELGTPPLALVADVYRIEILVREAGFQKLLCAQSGGSFHVRDPLLDTHFGVFHEPGTWATNEVVHLARPKIQSRGAEL